MNAYEKGTYSQVTMIDLGLEEDAQRLLVYKPADMRLVLAKVENWMRVLAYSHRDIFAVTLALYEAVTNSLRHGHHNDTSKPVQITYLVRYGEVLAEVFDQGTGFDYESTPGPFAEKILKQRCPRGIFLMRAYSSWLTYTGTGNRVTFCRRRNER